jgi:hypothetical protein
MGNISHFSLCVCMCVCAHMFRGLEGGGAESNIRIEITSKPLKKSTVMSTGYKTIIFPVSH